MATENISVTVRFRPLTPKELQEQETVAWRLLDSQTLARAEPKPFAPGDPCYEVTQVFDPTRSTVEVYEAAVKPLVCRTLQGFNSCVIVYGPAGSGKGHTTWGDASHPGIIPLAVSDLFSRISSLPCQDSEEQQQGQEPDAAECSLRVSYLEIRNDRVYDLLRPGSEELAVATSPQGGHCVCGQQEELVTGPTSVFQLLHVGRTGRIAATTADNTGAVVRTSASTVSSASSPSHTLIRLVVELRDLRNTSGASRISTLTFVDLAGPEHPATSTAAEPEPSTRRQEGRNVNTSLLALHTVVRELALRDSAAAATAGSGPRPPSNASGVHIPYRLSKLTRVLQPSLGGSTRTALICTLSPGHRHADSSSHVLAFAAAAKLVRNAVQPVEPLSMDARLQLQADRIADLERQLRGLMRRGPGEGHSASGTNAWAASASSGLGPGGAAQGLHEDDVDAAAALQRLKLRREKTEYDLLALRARCLQARGQVRGGSGGGAEGQEGRWLGGLQQECAAVLARLRALTEDMVRARAGLLDRRLEAHKRAAAKAALAEHGLTAPVLRRHIRAKLEAVRRLAEAPGVQKPSATRPGPDRLKSSRSSGLMLSKAAAPGQPRSSGAEKQRQQQQEQQQQLLQDALGRAAEAERRAEAAEVHVQTLLRALVEARSQLAEAQRAAEATARVHKEELQRRQVALEAAGKLLLGQRGSCNSNTDANGCGGIVSGGGGGGANVEGNDPLALLVAEQQVLHSLQQQQVARLAGQVEDQRARIDALLEERQELVRRLEDAQVQIKKVQQGGPSRAVAGAGGGSAGGSVVWTVAGDGMGCYDEGLATVKSVGGLGAPGVAAAAAVLPPGAAKERMEDTGCSKHPDWLGHRGVTHSASAPAAALVMSASELAQRAAVPPGPAAQPQEGEPAAAVAARDGVRASARAQCYQPAHEGDGGGPSEQPADTLDRLGRVGSWPMAVGSEYRPGEKPGSGGPMQEGHPGCGAGPRLDQRPRSSEAVGGADVGRGVRRETQVRRGNVRVAAAAGQVYTLGRQ